MSQDANDRKHLTPRQIVNRFRKGVYVDEGMEAISSAISSCGEAFDSVAVPFPTNIVEKVVENLGIARTLYERQKAGGGTDDISVPGPPQLKSILTDLSYPALWEAMRKEKTSIAFFDVLCERRLMGKYCLDADCGKKGDVVTVFSYAYMSDIERMGLDFSLFHLVLSFLFK